MLKLEAANKALTLLGVSAINSLSDDVQAARVVSGLFPSVERAVLSEFPWPEAQRAEALSPLSADAPQGWRYCFAYPEGAAALYQVYTERPWKKIPYAAQGGIIYTNEPGAWAEYTVAVDFELWPNLMAEAFTARLASDAAGALAGSPQLASAMLEKYGMLISMAKTNGLNEENAEHRRASHYIDVRV